MLGGAGCDDGGGGVSGVNPAAPGKPWETLAQWQLFSDTARQVPAERVIPYEVISPLFTDYAAKHRFLWIPEGTKVGYRAVGPWDLPVGSIVVKTFALPIDARDPSLGERLIETRLMIREPAGWVPHTYVYEPGDPDPKKAKRTLPGAVLPVSWIDADGATRTNDYAVPNTNECTECHGKTPETHLLGVRTRQLNRDGLTGGNQIDRVAAELGFDIAPPPFTERVTMPDPFGTAPLFDRARAYLDANCAHCHSAEGDVSQKAVFFDWEHSDPASASPADWGACKIPTSAGGATCDHVYDVVPGAPDSSVLICRVESDEPKVVMPPLGRRLVHAEGVELLRAWIAAMPADDCQ